MIARLTLLLTACCASAFSQTSGLSSLDRQVRDLVSGFKGDVSVYAKNLQTGRSFGLRATDPVRTASTIKLPIMATCFQLANDGTLDFDQPLKLLHEEKVTGSGILQEMSDNDQLPLRDVLDLMIVLSDNTATNLILNRIDGNTVNTFMQRLGLQQTRVMRKVLGDSDTVSKGITGEGAKPENQRWGLGRSSPFEMVTLLEKISKGELVSKAASDQMLAVLKRQRDHNGLGRDMKDVKVANKSGALDHLRSDVGILYAPAGPVAIAVTVDNMPEVDWSPDNPGELLISKISELVVKGL